MKADAGPGTSVSDHVELQDDAPARSHLDDRLNRRPLAQTLATRLRRRHEEGRDTSFLVHLDGRWGSGKTTALNLLAEELGDDWTVVRYNAWRQARVGPPWWTLLTSLRDAVQRRRGRAGRLALATRELVHQRVLGTTGLPASVLLLALAGLVFLLARPSHLNAADALTTVQGAAAVLTAAGTLFAGTQLGIRYFSWNSARGARSFEGLDSNPMDRVASHFTWLVGQESRPVAFFVDDLDRCSAGDVVELLEAVQTLVRDAGQSSEAALSPSFVVAADGAWIRNAFEQSYQEFAAHIAEPGRPLGYLFLAKIFQLTLPVPRVGPVRQEHYFRHLLGLREQDEAGTRVGERDVDATALLRAEDRLAAAANDEVQQQVLAELTPEVREVVAPVAVSRQTEPTFAQATEHRLTSYTPLLPDSPRTVKRFLNDFAMTRSVRTLEAQAIPTGTLALWTILQIRWPLLADSLIRHPEWIDCAATASPLTPLSDGDEEGDVGIMPEDPADAVPDEIRELLEDEQVRAVVTHQDGGPLTAELVRACRGG